MRTDRVQVVLRRRDGLEAVDLGFAMARAWWRPLMATWLALVVPLGAGLVVTLRDHPFWTIAVLWWLRPVFDRIPLHVLSEALFAERAGLSETVRALPSLLRSGLATSLFLQRLSPARTFLLPVLQLEGLRGTARRQRCAALARRDIAVSMGLLGTGAIFNAALMLGLLLVVQLLAPAEMLWDVFELLPPFGQDEDPGGQVLLPALYLVGTSIVEPLLVAGGFALYVNRRVYLEGWDIDLAFRNLARRAAAPLRARAATPAVAAGLLALVLTLAPLARADGVCEPGEPVSAGPCIEAVLDGPDFGRIEEVERWLPREFEGWNPDGPSLEWLGWLPGFLATGIELALWIGLAALVVSLLVLMSRRLGRAPASPSDAATPPTLFGLDLHPDSLPEDVVAAARACWARGAAIEALSLLYRGALVRLAERAALDVPPSATELECVRLVERTQDPEPARVFADLTGAWLGARYAGRPPEADRFEALCRRFGPAFGAAT